MAKNGKTWIKLSQIDVTRVVDHSHIIRVGIFRPIGNC